VGGGHDTTLEFLQLIAGANGLKNVAEVAVRFFSRKSGCEAVGIRLRVGEDYPYYESRGFSEAFLAAENSLCQGCMKKSGEGETAGNPTLACLCGKVIQGGVDSSMPYFSPLGSFWTNSTSELLASTLEKDPMARVRKQCNGEGYESVALIPLRLGRETLGLLQLNDKRKDRFTAEMIARWERLAGYLAVALAHGRAAEELRESQKVLRAAIESTSDLVFIKDLEGRYTLVNRAMCRLMGRSEAEVLGRDDVEIFGPEAAAVMKERDRGVLAGKVDSNYEMQLPGAGGQHTFLCTKTLLWDGEGKIKGIFGIARDISARKKAEAVQAARLRLLQLAPELPLGDFLRATIDEVEALTGSRVGFFHFVASDQTAVSLHVWSTNTMQHGCKAKGAGKHYPINEAGVWVDCIHARRPVIHNDYASLPHRKGMPEGHVRVVREVVVPVMRNGLIMALLGVGNKATDYTEEDVEQVSALADLAWDIAERKRAEEALRASEHLLMESQRIAGLGSYEMDFEAGTWKGSEVLDEILGIGPEYPRTNEGWEALIHPEDRAATTAYIQGKVWAMGKGFGHKCRIVRPNDQTVRWVHALGKVERDAGGRPVRLWGTIRDITERKAATEALKKSEEKFSKAFQTCAESLVITSVEGGAIVEANEAFLRKIGLSREEVIGRTSVELGFWTEQERGRFTNRLQAEGRVRNYEVKMRVPSGEVRDYILSSEKLELAGKHCCLNFIQDVTERKRAEELLKLRESYLTSIIENQPGLIWLKDKNGRFLAVNTAFASSCGMKSPEELVGKTDLDIWPTELAQKYVADDDKVKKEKKTVIVEEPIFDKGQTKWFETFKAPVCDHTGKVIGTTGYACDISERKQAEEALRRGERRLRESEARLATALEGAHLGLWEWDVRLNQSVWNAAQYELLGLPVGDGRVSTNDFFARVHPEDAAGLKAELKHAFENQKEFRAEFRVIRADGAERWIAGAGRVTQDAEGKPAKMIGIHQDITERWRAEEALRESERQYRSLFDGMSEGFAVHEIITDEAGRAVDFRFLDVNAAFERMMGLKRQAVVGRTFREVLSKEEETWLEIYGAVALKGKAAHFERYSPMLNRYYSVLAYRPGPGQFATIFLDVTEQKKAEAEIRLLKQSIDLNSDGAFWFDADHRIVYVNEAACRSLGYRREELIGQHSSLFDPGVTENGLAMMWGKIRTGGRAEREVVHRRKDGTVFPVELSCTLVNFGGKEYNCTFARDISARKKAEAEIQLLKQSIDLHLDGAYWFDTENRLVYVNEAGCRALGYSREELTGQHISLINPITTESRRAEGWEELRRSGRYVLETVHRRKDGTEFPVEISCTLVNFGGKEYNCGFARDISERKKAEAEISRHQGAVAHLARLNVMGQMATGLAHELNQPLTAIRNYAHYCRTVLETGENREEALPEALERIDQAVARASQIIQRMREFVRKEPPVRKEMDVNTMIRKCLNLLAPALNRQRIRVERGFAKQLPTVLADEVQIEQVVVNLITNAVDAMAETPTGSRIVRVETGVVGEESVVVAIADRGCGIAPENAERIFDEFFTTKTTGTGLGLSISKRIMESHGGRLTARANPGGGMLFELVLPLKKGN
jgi:PAS domain S-box-containing protein